MEQIMSEGCETKRLKKTSGNAVSAATSIKGKVESTAPSNAQCAGDHGDECACHAIRKPDYWAEACRHLTKKDRVMRRLIPKFGDVCLESHGDPFVTLARSIVGQQISVKAAQSVWDRFVQLPDPFTPEQVLKLRVDDMRAAGLSARKIEYLVDLALKFSNGALHIDEWQTMEDEAIAAELLAIRGVGRWTADMFLIFYLLRPNVLPLDDVGLLKGISTCYFSGDPVSRSDAREVAQAWAPYRSVATWYIWRSLEPLPVAY